MGRLWWWDLLLLTRHQTLYSRMINHTCTWCLDRRSIMHCGWSWHFTIYPSHIVVLGLFAFRTSITSQEDTPFAGFMAKTRLTPPTKFCVMHECITVLLNCSAWLRKDWRMVRSWRWCSSSIRVCAPILMVREHRGGGVPKGVPCLRMFATSKHVKNRQCIMY